MEGRGNAKINEPAAAQYPISRGSKDCPVPSGVSEAPTRTPTLNSDQNYPIVSPKKEQPGASKTKNQKGTRGEGLSFLENIPEENTDPESTIEPGQPYPMAHAKKGAPDAATDKRIKHGPGQPYPTAFPQAVTIGKGSNA